MSSLTAGIAWTTLARGTVVLVTLVVGVVVARLVGPTDMGNLSIALVMMTMTEGVFGVGLSRYLIQLPKASVEDKNVAFWGDVLSSGVGSMVLLGVVPFVTANYDPSIRPMVYALAGGVVLTGLASPFRNLAYSEMNFQLVAKVELTSALGSSSAAILALLSGFGVWAIILRELTKRALDAAVLLKLVRWRPSFQTSKDALKRAFRFNLPLYGVEALAQVAASTDQLIIGHRFTSADVGFYSRGQTLALLPLRQLIMIAAQILFPTLGRLPKDQLPAVYRQAVALMFVAGVPIVTILTILGDDLMVVLLGVAWRPAGLFIKIFAVSVLWSGSSDLLRSVFNSCGRSDYTLRSTTVSRVLRLLGIAVGAVFGVFGLAIGHAVGNVIGSLVEHEIARRFFKQPRWLLSKEVGPIVGAGALAALASAPLLYSLSAAWLRVLTVPFTVFAVFVGTLHLTKNRHWLLVRESIGAQYGARRKSNTPNPHDGP